MRAARFNKADRLLYPGASANEQECYYAAAPFDEAARQMDRKWGVGRLPDLVSVDLAAKFGRAVAKMNGAIEAGNAADVAAYAAAAVRGLAALDAEATARGAAPADPRVVVHEHNGFRFGLLLDADAWPAAQEQHPGLRLYTLNEVATALAAATPAAVAEVKRLFPGAQITEIRPRTRMEELVEDEIPF